MWGAGRRNQRRLPEGGGPNESSSRKSRPGSAQERGRASVLAGWREYLQSQIRVFGEWVQGQKE